MGGKEIVADVAKQAARFHFVGLTNLQYTWDSLLHTDDDTFVNNRIKKGLLIFLNR